VFNDRLDAAVAAFFMLSVIVVLIDSMREWYAVLNGRKAMVSSEVPYIARSGAPAA
jgi:carbon starvation protein